LGDAVAVTELARYQEGPASVVVSRDGGDLVFWSSAGASQVEAALRR
jgi:hypothetical protein